MSQPESDLELQSRLEAFCSPARGKVYETGDVIYYWEQHYLIIDGGYQELTGNRLWIYNTYCLEDNEVREMVFYPSGRKVE